MITPHPKTMITPKREEEIRHAAVSSVKKWYLDLGEVYNKVVDGYYRRCPICGEWKPTSQNFFPDDRFSDGVFYFCKSCVYHMAEQRYDDKQPINETKESIQSVLQLMDLPYIEDLYKSCVNMVKENDVITKAHKDTVFQTYYASVKHSKLYNELSWKDSTMEDTSSTLPQPRKDIIKIFGNSFSVEDLLYLQDQYDDWRSRTQVDTKSQEIYVTQICLQSLEIYNDRRQGIDVTNKLKALDTLMSSANLQPKQNVGNAATDSLVFGQLIEKWEQEKPISEPSPEFRDVDGIGKLIRVWVTGWLAKAIGIKNIFTKEFEDETNKYTVSKQNVKEDEISEDIYSKLFGDGIE